MEPIHHHAVAAAWAPQEEAEYRPFSGYGGDNGYYLRASPFRGDSTIPHHFAVESREGVGSTFVVCLPLSPDEAKPG